MGKGVIGKDGMVFPGCSWGSGLQHLDVDGDNRIGVCMEVTGSEWAQNFLDVDMGTGWGQG